MIIRTEYDVSTLVRLGENKGTEAARCLYDIRHISKHGFTYSRCVFKGLETWIQEGSRTIIRLYDEPMEGRMAGSGLVLSQETINQENMD
jgi:hypothetical protein